MSATATTLNDYQPLSFGSLMQPILGFVFSEKEIQQRRVSPTSPRAAQVADLTSAVYKELLIEAPQHNTWSPVELDWQAAYKEMENSKVKFHPSYVPTSEQACSVALKALRSIRAKFSSLAPPEVTPDGEGNLYLEWQTENKHLSLCFANNPQGSYIYLSDGDGYEAYPLTEENLHNSVVSYL